MKEKSNPFHGELEAPASKQATVEELVAVGRPF